MRSCSPARTRRRPTTSSAAAELARCRSGAVLVNVARGSVVDEPALVDALRSGRLGGACARCLRDRAAACASPLWDMPNVLVSPHSASTVDGENELIVDLFLDNLSATSRVGRCATASTPRAGLLRRWLRNPGHRGRSEPARLVRTRLVGYIGQPSLNVVTQPSGHVVGLPGQGGVVPGRDAGRPRRGAGHRITSSPVCPCTIPTRMRTGHCRSWPASATPPPSSTVRRRERAAWSSASTARC